MKAAGDFCTVSLIVLAAVPSFLHAADGIPADVLQGLKRGEDSALSGVAKYRVLIEGYWIDEADLNDPDIVMPSYSDPMTITLWPCGWSWKRDIA